MIPEPLGVDVGGIKEDLMDLDRKTAADGREYYRGLRRRRVHESSAGGMQSVDPDGMCWPRGWVMAKVRRRTTRRPSSSCWIPPFRRRGSRGWPVTASITISTTTRTISNISICGCGIAVTTLRRSRARISSIRRTRWEAPVCRSPSPMTGSLVIAGCRRPPEHARQVRALEPRHDRRRAAAWAAAILRSARARSLD